LANLDELSAMDDGAAESLGLDSVAGQIRDSLASEGFADQLATVRGGVRKVDEAVGTAFEATLKALTADVGDMISRLEAMPQWVRLSDDDRSEIGLRAKFPARAAAGLTGSPTSRYKLVLAHRAGVRTLGDALVEEVRKRAAPPDDVLRVARVRPDEILAATVVTQATLEPWLSGLRGRVSDLLVDNDEVRIEDDLG
jgi:hypothetical protein